MREPFEGLFGNNCESRLLEFLLPLDGIDFNAEDLAKEICVSKETIVRVVKKFIDLKVMKLTCELNCEGYYRINPESPIVKSIEQLNNSLVEHIVGEEMLYEIHDYWKSKN